VPDDCPSSIELEHLATGAAVREHVREHVGACAACSEAVARLRADNALLAEVVAASPDLGAAAQTGATPLPEIDGYEVVEELHRGGQGIVFRALQTATRRDVAVKTLGRGAFATAKQRHRFEREVELVAALRHPGIVTIHDSGRTLDGTHFLAMELVDGVTLDTYAFGATAPGPPGNLVAVRARIRVLVAIAEAVNAAHQRGIIHRDLKPANILVEPTGTPRILDFGLAKRQHVSDEGAVATMAGEFLGTFAYAAPEQIAGDPDAIDIRTDVHALGIILYELLTGERPYVLEGSVADVVDTIRTAIPGKPSRLNPVIDADLDAIALTALARNPEDRYQSAGAMQRDLERFLADEPVEVRRDHHWYVLRKTLHRYRMPIGIAASFVLLVLVFGIGMAALAVKASHSAETATNEATKARERLDSFMAVLASDSLRSRVDADTLPALYAEADSIVSEHLAGQPEAAARVRHEFGNSLFELGRYEAALGQFDEVLALVEAFEPPDAALIGRAHHDRGRSLWHLGRYDDAERAYGTALDVRTRALGSNDADTLQTLSHLAATYRQQGRYAEAQERYEAVLEQRRELFGSSHRWVAASLNNLAGCLRDQRRFEDAQRTFEEAVVMISSLEGQAHPWVGQGLHNIGACMLGRGLHDDAERVLGEALAIKRMHREDVHVSVMLTRSTLAVRWFERGDLDRAEDAIPAILTAQEMAYDGDHLEIADTLALRGRIRRARGDDGAARADLERALRIRERRLPESHWLLAETRALLAAG
jgi:serine/threonine protein kinase